MTNLADGFLPHGQCYLWNSGLVWLHLTSDTLIGLSYVAISASLTYLVHRARRDIPFHWVFLAFGTFIIACGATHFMEVWTLWTPTYWLAGDVKALTALASVATALVLPPLIPKTLSLIQAAKLSEERKLGLERANQELEVLYRRVKELDELKSQLFANVSHELRTPLMLITGPTERLLKSGALTDKQRHDLTVVERNAKTLLRHVNDLLDIAKLDAGKILVQPGATDVGALVRLTAAQFDAAKEERRITFSVETPPHLWVRTDAEKLQRILVNLLSNAFKFVHDGGAVRCTLDASEGGIVLIVEDNGPGVPLEQREAIFERFRQGDGGATRRYGGTGLGLAIAKELCELLGGRIWADEAPGGGARFQVHLPVQPAESEAIEGKTAEAEPSAQDVPASGSGAQELVEPNHEPRPGSAADASPPTSGGTGAHNGSAPTILVVEDNVELSRFLIESLSVPYQVTAAADGDEGLKKALELRPDLIITDIMMPDMSGDQLIRRLRELPELKEVPVLVLTAKADEDLRVRLLKEGVQDYLSKPFSIEELSARVRTLIAQRKRLAGAEENVSRLLVEAERRNKELRDKQLLLIQSAKLASLGEMAAGIAHELNNPLNNIGLFIGNAIDRLERGQATGMMIGDLERALQQVRRAASIIGHLRTFARAGASEREPTLVHDVIHAALSLVEEPLRMANISVDLNLGADQASVLANRIQLEQVFINLLVNAKDAMADGPVKRMTISTAFLGPQVEVLVKDTGSGIPLEVQDRIFDPFFTTKPVGLGTGLGLSITYGIVKEHGGDIQVVSTPGHGTTFVIQLPLVDRSMATPTAVR
ncbi:ATP-binding protein [Candidatus Nitrospira bockiana]